jgi:DNA helicase-2/ATP-dependent DNA helicase PcrA
MMRDPKIGDQIRSRFDHVLVDEYQDTNPLQAEILFALKPKGRGLTVVGRRRTSHLLASGRDGSQHP